MTDSAVTFLVQYLTQLFIQETNFLAGVEDQVKSLREGLNNINAFLEDSEGERSEREVVKNLIKRIRDFAHEAEDAIDVYIYNEAKQKRRNMARKTIHFMNHKATLHDIGKKIEGLQVDINKIYNDIDKFGIKRTEAEARKHAKDSEALHKRRICVEEDDVVGFDHDSTILVKQLCEGKPELEINLIFGMGGLGKTTLAKKVYNNVFVKSHFNCRAWVYVSQDYRSKELLIEILKHEKQKSKSRSHLSQESLLKKQTRKKLEDMSEKELKDKLEKYLRGKKYLIVMDDVWKSEIWDVVKTAFPDNLKGSRILITSREKKVAPPEYSSTAYQLPFLNKDESWELLRKKVFRGEECPLELVDLGKQIAESCDGLPLSIVVMGGLLSKEERRKSKWEKYIGNENWYLTRDKKQCKDILALSYNHLPRYLKPCFLYFGLYPEDYEIPVRQLIQLWIAEGFIEDTRGRNLEDVAEYYLNELIDRSLIQVASWRMDGEAKTCRIHDLLRDLCISESREDKFFEVRTDAINPYTNKTRRLSILGSTPQYISSNPSDPSGARSLFFFDQNSCRFNEKDHWKWVCNNFKLVRVLSLGHAIPYSIPIKKLILLKYLRIETEAPNLIPDCICELWYLETLDARRSSLICLPTGIWKLQRLRNLYLSGPVRFPDPSNADVKALSCLQVLSTVIVDAQTASLISQGKLPNLRKLGISYRMAANHWAPDQRRDASSSKRTKKLELRPREALASLHHLSHLKTLKIMNCSKLPNHPSSFPETITKISLASVDLNVITLLGKLPKLRILKLSVCAGNNRLRISAGSYPELEVLKLDQLKIREWKQGRGSMPALRHLVIQKCKNLTMLPEELCSIPSLRDMKVLWTNSELARKLQELQMKVGFKLQIYPHLN